MKWISLLAFALLIFFIPLLSLHTQTLEPTEIPAQKSVVQSETNNLNNIPAISSSAPAMPDTPTEQTSPPPAAQTLALTDDGFRVYDSGKGNCFTVTAEEFARGALAAELPPTFHPEALKAQAVAAHTYALNLKQSNAAGQGNPDWQGADVTADPQNWKGYVTKELFYERYGTLADAYWKTICDAADAVCAYALTYEDEPIVAAYHSMSAGMTEDAANVWTGSKPYLVPVESAGDPLAPDYETTETFSAEELRTALQTLDSKIELPEDPSAWLVIDERSPGGYVTAMRAGSLTLHGKDLRSALDLRSSNFTVAWDGTKFTFTIHGYGHGVGLSQYGADYLARQGSSFDEILTHYYPGATLKAIAQK